MGACIIADLYPDQINYAWEWIEQKLHKRFHAYLLRCFSRSYLAEYQMRTHGISSVLLPFIKAPCPTHLQLVQSLFKYFPFLSQPQPNHWANSPPQWLSALVACVWSSAFCDGSSAVYMVAATTSKWSGPTTDGMLIPSAESAHKIGL